MANPRRKHSKSRTRKRRSVYYGSLSAPTIVECECGKTVKLRHRVCASCGMYRGRQIVERPADA
ncbi:MAG: 50S ribosomal protein L32 [Bacteroidetes bacterium]|nr:50S ribosomal protein L32 [Bacteroidota bacterium]MCY3594959.1 50S ribosomal protein L32 [Bacteroidota bacterium]